ncbi:hypothetical protein LCGC14_1198820 [marine sediment metagenome]|uniref:Uncharacterized protein n=1 Tax=marine sediment metagenome TaxID=412755 RepID=A0A0F9LHK0_9ZZZZ
MSHDTLTPSQFRWLGDYDKWAQIWFALERPSESGVTKRHRDMVWEPEA